MINIDQPEGVDEVWCSAINEVLFEKKPDSLGSNILAKMLELQRPYLTNLEISDITQYYSSGALSSGINHINKRLKLGWRIETDSNDNSIGIILFENEEQRKNLRICLENNLMQFYDHQCFTSEQIESSSYMLIDDSGQKIEFDFITFSCFTSTYSRTQAPPVACRITNKNSESDQTFFLSSSTQLKFLECLVQNGGYIDSVILEQNGFEAIYIQGYVNNINAILKENNAFFPAVYIQEKKPGYGLSIFEFPRRKFLENWIKTRSKFRFVDEIFPNDRNALLYDNNSLPYARIACVDLREHGCKLNSTHVKDPINTDNKNNSSNKNSFAYNQEYPYLLAIQKIKNSDLYFFEITQKERTCLEYYLAVGKTKMERSELLRLFKPNAQDITFKSLTKREQQIFNTIGTTINRMVFRFNQFYPNHIPSRGLSLILEEAKEKHGEM